MAVKNGRERIGERNMLNFIDDNERRAIIRILNNCDGKSCFDCKYYKACRTMPLIKNIPQMKKFMEEMRKAEEDGEDDSTKEGAN